MREQEEDRKRKNDGERQQHEWEEKLKSPEKKNRIKGKATESWNRTEKQRVEI